MTYKQRDICGLKGSSVQFPCSYPPNFQVIRILGWTRRLPPNMNPKPLKAIPAYSFRMRDLKRGSNDCTLELADLKMSDASTYYFTYSFRNATGYHMWCIGVPGVNLYIIRSPVSILVEKLVRGQNVPAADCTVMEGQSIKLTCVSTCTANLISNPGYMWYKDRVQLNGSRADSLFLFLDSISDADAGSYVCASESYKDLPSSAVSLRVQGRPRNSVVSEIPESGFKDDRVPTLTHGDDAQNSTDQGQEPKGKVRFTLMLIASVCAGLLIAVMVVTLVLKVKKKNKRRNAGSVSSPNHNSAVYMALNVTTLSADYETLDTVRHCLAAAPVYENVHQPKSP